MSDDDLVTQSLRRLHGKAVDALADVRPGKLKSVVRLLLGELGRRTNLPHVHLYSVRRMPGKFSSALLAAEWSHNDVHLGGAALNRFPLSFFSSEVVEQLSQDKIAFSRIGDNGHTRSRFVTAVLQEVQASSYLICPVLLQQRLCGLIAFAASSTTVPLSVTVCREVQLFGKILLNGILANRRDARRLEEQLQWKRVADAACDFSIALNQLREISHVQKFGAHRAPEVAGFQFLDFVARPFRSEITAILDRSIETHSAATCEFRGADGRGEECWYHGRIEPQSRDSQIVATIYLTNNDVIRKGEEEIRMMQERLERAARLSLLGQLSTEFAHQLNQPLQAVMAYCDTLSSRITAGRRNRAKDLKSLASIMESVEHASKIIRRIREFVRFRSLTLECADLQRIIDRAYLMTSHRAMMDRAELVLVPIDPELLIPDGLYVNVDSVQTTHVLINLIVNAIEAGTTAGISSLKIEVLVQNGPKQIRCSSSSVTTGQGYRQMLNASSSGFIPPKLKASASDSPSAEMSLKRREVTSQPEICPQVAANSTSMFSVTTRVTVTLMK